MIFNAFNLLATQLAAYIKSIGGEEQDVIMANIATIENTVESGQDFNKKIIMTLVNTQEEAALKNGSSVIRTSQGISYQNSPIFLNLFILITANYDVYGDALERLSNVIQFFQGKSTFSLANSPSLELLKNPDQYTDMKLFIEMVSLSFEQLNHLWASLGGKQLPSVLFKVRLVKITDNRTTGSGSLIEEIMINGNVTAQNRR